MFLSAAPSSLSAELLSLVTNSEVLGVNWDTDATMATHVATNALVDRFAIDVWVRPMNDSSFVFVCINRDPTTPRDATIVFGDGNDGGFVGRRKKKLKKKKKQEIGKQNMEMEIKNDHKAC